MPDKMGDILVGIMVIVVGVLMIRYRWQQSRHAMEFQNKVFGFNFGERDIRISTYIYIIGGIYSIAWGILVLTGVIKPH